MQTHASWQPALACLDGANPYFLATCTGLPDGASPCFLAACTGPCGSWLASDEARTGDAWQASAPWGSSRKRDRTYPSSYA
jgi:hypothetical protein